MNLIYHATAEEAGRAFWSFLEQEGISIDDPDEGVFGAIDEDGNEVTMSFSEYLAGVQATIDANGFWGFFSEQEQAIHCVINRQTVTLAGLIEFFAHELGHAEPDRITDGDLEEKANSYQRVAIKAYQLAQKVLSQE